MINSNVRKKLSKIKIVLTDVDGVLTDGDAFREIEDLVLIQVKKIGDK